MNAIELLKNQHKKTKRALELLSEGKAPSTSMAVLEQLADELVAHMVIEEHVFYPRIKQLIPKLTLEAYEEHAVARFELARLLTASAGDRKTRAMVLKELLEHHIDEEENELFPKVKKSIDAHELEVLGTRMEAMFEAAVEKGFAALVASPAESLRSIDIVEKKGRGDVGFKRTRRDVAPESTR